MVRMKMVHINNSNDTHLHIHVHTLTDTHTSTYTQMSTHTHKHTTQTHSCTYTQTDVHTHAYIQIFTHTHTDRYPHTRICTDTHTQTDVHTHIYIQTDVHQHVLNLRGFFLLRNVRWLHSVYNALYQNSEFAYIPMAHEVFYEIDVFGEQFISVKSKEITLLLLLHIGLHPPLYLKQFMTTHAKELLDLTLCVLHCRRVSNVYIWV